MKRNQLNVAFCRRVTEPGKYHDGWGLFLRVSPTGSKSWVQRLTVFGRRRELGLGSFNFVTLASAREAAFENMRAARRGDDPTAARDRAVPTFAEAAEAVIAIQRAEWKPGSKNEATWRSTLADYAYPRLGRMPVDKIGGQDVLACLLPLWSDKRATAQRVRSRIRAVLNWAVAEGHRPDNPAGESISAALPRGGAPVTRRAALPYEDVAEALDRITAAHGRAPAALALEWIALTACRSVEARHATWAEIDLDAATWTIPASRMKTGKEHAVPLSDRALAILRHAASTRQTDGLLFPPVRGMALSDATLSKIMRDLKIPAVPHGFRSSFRTWCAERTNVAKDIAEAALAHTVSNGVEAAYNRAVHFEARRDLMAGWARFLDGDAIAVCNA